MHKASRPLAARFGFGFSIATAIAMAAMGLPSVAAAQDEGASMPPARETHEARPQPTAQSGAARAAEARTAHAKEATERRRAQEGERLRHLERLRRLREDLRRVDHARDKWWKQSVRSQIVSELQRHRAWLREHRVRR